MAGWLERHRHDDAVAHWRKAEQAWEADDHDLETLRDLAATDTGLTKKDDPSIPVELYTGEHGFYVMSGAGLIEPRRLPSTWQGGHSGFSFRIAKGVRWHVGGTQGHTVPGEEVPTVIDTGIVTITDQRVVFQGAKHAREWDFAKLLGYQHDLTSPWTAIQVSNRERVSGIRYDREHADMFHFRLALALAHYKGEVAGFVEHLKRQIAEHAAARPLPPPPLPA